MFFTVFLMANLSCSISSSRAVASRFAELFDFRARPGRRVGPAGRVASRFAELFDFRDFMGKSFTASVFIAGGSKPEGALPALIAGLALSPGDPHDEQADAVERDEDAAEGEEEAGADAELFLGAAQGAGAAAGAF